MKVYLSKIRDTSYRCLQYFNIHKQLRVVETFSSPDSTQVKTLVFWSNYQFENIQPTKIRKDRCKAVNSIDTSPRSYLDTYGFKIFIYGLPRKLL